MPVYIADLDGSNMKVLLEDVPQAGYFLSDGEYLYFLMTGWRTLMIGFGIRENMLCMTRTCRS